MMKKITLLIVTLTISFAFNAQTVTHNLSQDIEVGVGLTCSGSNIASDNNFFGVFDLATDFGISYNFLIQEFEFGLETLANAPGDAFPVTINFYSTDNGAPTGTLTQLGTSTVITVSSTDAMTVVNIDVSAAGAVLPTGEVLVVEVAIVGDGLTDFRFGANNGGATDDSWIMAPECGLNDPGTYASIGFTQHHIMNVTGSDTASIANNVIDGFNMYPNPVIDVLNLKADVNIDAVSIFNMLGQKVVQTANTQIDMSNLPTGSYIVKITAGEQIGSYNFIKQ